MRRVRRVADNLKTIHAREPQLIKLPIALPSIPILSPILDPILDPIIGGSDQNQNQNTTPGTTAAANTPPPAQPTPPVAQPTPPVAQPTPPVAQPTPPAAQPTPPVIQPTPPVAQPVPAVAQPVPPVAQPVPPVAQPIPPVTQPIPPVVQPAPPSSPPPNNGGDVSPPSGSTPNPGGAGSPGPVPAVVVVPASGTDSGSGNTPNPGPVPAVVVVPASGTDSGDTPASRSSGDSPTGSGTVPSGGASPTSGSVLVGEGGAANLGSGTNDPFGGVANAAGVTIASQGSPSKNSGGTNTLNAGGSTSTASGNDPNNVNTVSGAEKGHISMGVVAAIVIICLAFFFVLLVFFLRRRSRARRNKQANTWWFSRKRTSQTYGDAEVLVTGSQNARNSFASSPTNPRFPPMAEVRQVTAGSLQAVIDSSRYHPAEVPHHRFSVGSNHSENSQFLFVNLRSSLQITPTDQAFSPSSQSFAFPKPPSLAGDRTSAYSRPSSHHGTVRTIMRRPNSDDSIFSSLPPVPSLPSAAPLIGDDPFASDPFGDNNPFEDPQRAAAPTTLKEIICQPYQRTLEDEVTVSVGEYVHVLTTFDDGWAYVVKVPPTGSGRGDNEDASGGSKGLIPIDCLREPGEDLPASIAAKRVSSYGDEATFTAL